SISPDSQGVECTSASTAGRSDRRRSPSGARVACRSRECGTSPIRLWSGCPPSHRAKKPRSPAKHRWGTSEGLLPDLPFPLIKVPELAPGHDFLKIVSGRFAAALFGGQVAR